MDNSKIPYLSPRVTFVMLSSTRHILATSTTANDSLSDFGETTPTWTID